MIENGGPVRGKKKKRRITAFYIEALLLVAAFTMVILVLTRVFAWAGQLGREAGILTKAVHLAENGMGHLRKAAVSSLHGTTRI